MKYDMNQEVLGFNGEPIVKSEEDRSPVVLGEALQMACVNANTQTHSSGEQKFKIYRILQKITGSDEVELGSEEIILLKTLVGEIYGVAMVGPIYDILEKSD